MHIRVLLCCALLATGASSAQSAFILRLAEKDRKRFMTLGGAAVSGKYAENVFSYNLVGKKLIVEGGVAHNSTIGAVSLKGEWKWVTGRP